MPLTKVGILDEHGPVLVLPSYSQECVADWISSDADLLRNALSFVRSGAAATQLGLAGRLDGTYFLPVSHGGKDMSYSFNFWLPPPYRVIMLISLGLLCYANNLHTLGGLALDPARLPNFSHESASKTGSGHGHLPQHRPLTSASPGNPSGSGSESSASLSQLQVSTSSLLRYRAAYVLALVYAVLSTFGWLSFRYWVDGAPSGDPFGNHAQFYQGVIFFGAISLSLWPGRLLFKSVRFTFLRSLLRISKPSFAQRISFGEVLLADSLTSFAKVFGDVWLSLCFLWPRQEHHTWWNGKGSLAVPFMVSLPYLIRLRQCLSEYATSAPTVSLQSGKGRRSRKPLANALKYATVLPVIWLSALHEMARDAVLLELDARVIPIEELDSGLRRYGDLIFQLWLFAVFVNTIFSFWWDVTNDWGLDLLRFSTWSSAAPGLAKGVRQSLHKRGISGVSSVRAAYGRRLSWRPPSLLGRADTVISEERDEEESGDGRSKASDRKHFSELRRGQIAPGDAQDVRTSPAMAIEESGEVRGIHQRANEDMTPSASGFSPDARSLSSSSSPFGPASPSDAFSSSSLLQPPSLATQHHHHHDQHRRKSSVALLRSPAKGHSMLFHPLAYQIIVVLNLILRFLWSLKLSSRLHHIAELEAGVFTLEALEIVRRWAWVFLRVEWEFVKQRRLTASISEGGAAASAETAATPSSTSSSASSCASSFSSSAAAARATDTANGDTAPPTGKVRAYEGEGR
ncbi:EXS-domain-containing protein [Tilletiaria anomala UBC 951]|uniref:EXS-domain-containing protein n=1 Tax=Tilletiaria anomala (strain ATCC 24038 / CBS 436.72 / UBC 951) TaxID=1037660 RepID=A0A066WFV6_TILAU|nr:EXS-domain-containing protein [Tilletiaria anomala UBC 951]KDN49954.1 EXS-domain-containing protein [Tilletiaria anomala UBC 951]